MSLEEPLRCGGQYGPFFLSRALASLGHEVHVICRGRKGDEKHQKLDGVDVHRYHSYSHIGGTRQSMSLSLHRLVLFIKLVERYEFDVINAQTPIVFESFVAKRKHLPIVYISQGVIGMYAKNLSMSARDLLNKMAMRFLSIPAAKHTFRKCDKILGVAKDDVMKIAEHFKIKQDKLALIHNGVDLSRFNTQVDAGGIRAKYKLDGKNVILFLGRLHPHKGVHNIIEAAPSVIRDFPNSIFLIVGVVDSPGYQKELAKRIFNSRLDSHIRIINDVSERQKPEYYRAADMSIIFSEGYDPAPNTIIESMACGLPIISVDFPARYEKIKHGINCLMVPEGDVDGLAKAIKKLLSEKDYARVMGELNYKMARYNYDARFAAERFVELVKNISK
ncbi:hypothetical protein AMJ83_11135 [candidate division WOR_3 bacterium SM23_42]|uniref:Glycosyltransferase subfamily 4-like N-terminal domain-containing protein n=1 Tax=candidate division WOR_3 bacterium SM23_42 TaxID=1703779 RepID=A0A0S8FNR2_UNCW3|nr:MAG: hypothetical protein AMJ83_11135 [candidate division WOR_3 bacterium SM23_42]